MRKILTWRKEQDKDPFRRTKWTTTEINARIRNGGSLSLALHEQLEHKELREFLAADLAAEGKRGLKELAGRRDLDEESLGARIRQVREALRLTEVEEEILLYAYLSNTDPEAQLLHEFIKPWTESTRHEKCPPSRDRMDSGVLATLLGYSKSEVESALALEGALLRVGLLNGDFEIEGGVRDFIERGGGANILEKHFKIYTGPTLPTASYTVNPAERDILLELLRTHGERRPLHILLWGDEGTGKSSFSQSLAAETGRILFQVGVNLRESMEDLWGQRNAAIQYGMRALQMASNQTEGKKAVLVVDEADTLLNEGEKGRLNTLMESIHTPVIWISNKLDMVERSTLRRFSFSIAFRKLGEVQRKGLWANILQKHNALDLVPAASIEAFAVRYPAAAGGIELAVQSTVAVAGRASSISPERIMEGVLASHGRLMELPSEEKGRAARAPSYSLEGLNINGGLPRTLDTLRAFNRRWQDHRASPEPCNLAVLLYGPPGTGKTEFVRYLARDLGRPLHLKQVSDLLSKWVGGTEKLIKEAFEEASQEGAILFLDEVDSFLQDRTRATKSWEVTHVNELLVQMEAFNGLLVCSTNLVASLDEASRRRFHLKLEFGYLQGEGAKHFWNVFFAGMVNREPGENFLQNLCSLPLLAPGDFKAAYERLRYAGPGEVTPEWVHEELLGEIAHKDPRAGRSLGFKCAVSNP